ncbi:hypothetical protein [Tunturiibacter gelidoferens]|uniref:ABC-type multidrug transport system fused ATPase/permease subunit n=1 Tax=Tunturiibacter gelidiferens TaxID=3069689 RepID=A0ACC5P4B6_9BACT|nr:hypothetical protein [Edaphobacter lichenicola]MBB5341466.1 ABC-type multidrug transport system fused ATPase/permease subunit [Edaphobacter lichenicola]
MASEIDTSFRNRSWNEWFREWLATIVVLISVVAVAILGGIAIYSEKAQAKEILTMVLPMIGTWVGTVLAFYFGKEQLEAATRSVTAIARELTPEEKLRSIKVTDKMIPRAAAYVVSEDPDKLKLLDAVAGLEKVKKGSRLPILTNENTPRYVIHRSTIDRFLSKAAAAGKQVGELQQLTLNDLLADPDFKINLENTFAIVPETATLADAKRAMGSLPSCQDVFVTRTGASSEPISGWVTNVIIEDNSRVG